MCVYIHVYVIHTQTYARVYMYNTYIFVRTNLHMRACTSQTSIKIDKAREDASMEPLYVNSDASKPSHTTVAFDEYGVPTVDRYVCMYVRM